MQSYLSRNFKVAEIFPAGKTGGIPSKENLHKAGYLVEEILQPSRDAIDKPVNVNSGMRSRKENRRVGGVWNSEHLFKGDSAAVDVDAGQYNPGLFEALKQHVRKIGQLIAYIDVHGEVRFIHVSIATPKHNGEIKIATYEKEKRGRFGRLKRHYATYHGKLVRP